MPYQSRKYAYLESNPVLVIFQCFLYIFFGFIIFIFDLSLYRNYGIEEMVKYDLPKINQVETIENKNLVSHIFVGKPRNEKLGNEPVIQVNDIFISIQDLPIFIEEEKLKLKENERDNLVIMLHIDKNVKMGLINDIKSALQKAEVQKIYYAANPRFQKMNELKYLNKFINH